MAMIHCPECGHEISDKAKVCIHCGYPLDQLPAASPDEAKGFWARAGEQAKQISTEKQAKKALSVKSRIKENEAKGIACCPKCASTSLSAQKKGFGVGKATVGAVIAAPIFFPLGLVAGNIGAKKVRVTCLSCGHQFWAGKK